MASNIDGTIPVTATPISAAEIQQNFAAARDEIDALQLADGSKVDTTRTIVAGTGLTGGGDLSQDRQFDLADTAVTPGTYQLATITIDQQGRITLAATGSIGGWVDGTTVTDWVDGAQNLGAVSSNTDVDLTSGHTIEATMTADVTFNFQHGGGPAIGEAVHWDMILGTGGFTPTFQFESVTCTLPDGYDVATDATYILSFVATNNGSWFSLVRTA